MIFDVIVVGGSYAGMSAALQIARARRRVLIVDSGMPRNRFAAASHGFLANDGRTPAEIASDGRAELTKYATIVWKQAIVEGAAKEEHCFVISTEDGTTYEAKRVVLATGVQDDLPDIPGLKERWGKYVFHCPYCHGYELNQGRIGVLATGPIAMHLALMLPDWGQTTLFTNGVIEPDPDQFQRLNSRGVHIETERVEEITGDRVDVRLRSGQTVRLDGLFAAPGTRIPSALVQQLGCALDEGPLGWFIRTDSFKETTTPGVFACGDVARPAGSVALAVGDGAVAGTAVHQSLIFR